jgi:hypothetical protein
VFASLAELGRELIHERAAVAREAAKGHRQLNWPVSQG